MFVIGRNCNLCGYAGEESVPLNYFAPACEETQRKVEPQKPFRWGSLIIYDSFADCVYSRGTVRRNTLCRGRGCHVPLFVIVICFIGELNCRRCPPRYNNEHDRTRRFEPNISLTSVSGSTVHIVGSTQIMHNVNAK